MRKDSPIRWTRNKASQEFGLADKTLTARLRKYGVEPGEDGCYSTKQICTAVFGDLDGERLRLITEQADKLAIENAQSRRDLIPLKEIADSINRAISSIKASIMSASNLEREDKEKILRQCGDLWQAALGGDNTNVEPSAALPGQ